MSRIYHSPLTGYIDLDKIARITDAQITYAGRAGGWWVRCQIDIQLRDAPIEYTRAIGGDEDDYDFDLGYRIRLTDNSLIDPDKEHLIPRSSYLSVARLQAQIDKLVAAWKAPV